MGVSPISSNNENFGKWVNPVIEDAVRLHEDLQAGVSSPEQISQEAEKLYNELSNFPNGAPLQQALIPFLSSANNPTQEQTNDLLAALDNFVH